MRRKHALGWSLNQTLSQLTPILSSGSAVDKVFFKNKLTLLLNPFAQFKHFKKPSHLKTLLYKETKHYYKTYRKNKQKNQNKKNQRWNLSDLKNNYLPVTSLWWQDRGGLPPREGQEGRAAQLCSWGCSWLPAWSHGTAITACALTPQETHLKIRLKMYFKEKEDIKNMK